MPATRQTIVPKTTTTIKETNTNTNNNTENTNKTTKLTPPPKPTNIAAQKLNPNKFASPFENNTNKCKSVFSQCYISGSIPCRLQTSGSRYNLQWDEGAESGFSPELLIVCASGLVETVHPYCIMAPLMFVELCSRAEGCLEMFTPETMESVCGYIRGALSNAFSLSLSSSSLTNKNINNNNNNNNNKLCNTVLQSLDTLMNEARHLILPQLHKIIPILARPYSSDKKMREAITAVLRKMECICGPEATKLIKLKIPTYM